MFWDKYPANMYYSTSRRGTLNASVLPPPPEVANYESPASDWTCTKVSEPFDSKVYVVNGISSAFTFWCCLTLPNWYVADLLSSRYWNLMMIYLNGESEEMKKQLRVRHGDG